jgi:hypothetical protein
MNELSKHEKIAMLKLKAEGLRNEIHGSSTECNEIENEFHVMQKNV